MSLHRDIPSPLRHLPDDSTGSTSVLFPLFVIWQQDASTTYSHCLQTCGTFGKGWLTWGRHLDKVFEDDPSKANNGEKARGELGL